MQFFFLIGLLISEEKSLNIFPIDPMLKLNPPMAAILDEDRDQLFESLWITQASFTQCLLKICLLLSDEKKIRYFP